MSRRILMLRSSIGVFGAETVMLELAKELGRSREYHPIVGVIENSDPGCGELASAARELALEVEVFPGSKPFDPGALRKIRQYVQAGRAQIVHAHGYKANLYALLSTSGLGVPRIATCHPWTETAYSLKARVYTHLDKRWLRRMDSLVAISPEILRQLQAALPGRKIALIPNGIDTEAFANHASLGPLRQELGITSEHLVVGTIGRLVQEKGYVFFLACAKRLACAYKKLKILIIGDGPQRRELQERAIADGLRQSVTFLGVRKDIPQLLSLMNIFVLSSISEGLPMVLLEAMAAGKPVVATRVGDIPNVVEHGVSALLAPPAEPDALADAVEVLLSNPDLREQLGRSARLKVASEYSARQMARAYTKIYERLPLSVNLPIS